MGGSVGSSGFPVGLLHGRHRVTKDAVSNIGEKEKCGGNTPETRLEVVVADA